MSCFKLKLNKSYSYQSNKQNQQKDIEALPPFKQVVNYNIKMSEIQKINIYKLDNNNNSHLSIFSMDTDLSCVFEGLAPTGALYISNSKTAQNFPALEKLNIKAVITAAKGRRMDCSKSKIERYLYLEIEDYQDFDIERYFDGTFQFIEEARKFSNVLIHCHIGASRSVAIVMAYLIRKYSYSLPQIYSLIKRKRSKIQPNPGFVRQLQRYGEKYGIESTDMPISKSRPKLKVQRSMSLSNSKKSEPFELMQGSRQIKSQELKQKSRRTSVEKGLFQEQNSEIELLHKKREQIEWKLRNLRHGLIKGGQVMRKWEGNTTISKISNKPQPQPKSSTSPHPDPDPNTQNSNPNNPQPIIDLDPLVKKQTYSTRLTSRLHNSSTKHVLNAKNKEKEQNMREVSLFCREFGEFKVGCNP